MTTGQYRIVTNGTKYYVECLHIYYFFWWRWERWLTEGYYNISTEQNIWMTHAFDTIENAKTWVIERKLLHQCYQDGHPRSLMPVSTKESGQ